MTLQDALELVQLHLSDCLAEGKAPEEWVERSLHDAEVSAVQVAAGVSIGRMSHTTKQSEADIAKGIEVMRASGDYLIFQKLWLEMAVVAAITAALFAATLLLMPGIR